jgi:hypothetical protein
LFLYWDGKRRGRRWPARGDLDPLDFPYVLGWVALVDVDREPLRFRYRLMGVLLVERFGFDMTGRSLEEFPQPQFRRFLEEVWSDTVQRAAPTHQFHDMLVDGHRRDFETLRLPLASDGETIDMLIIASVHRR